MPEITISDCSEANMLLVSEGEGEEDDVTPDVSRIEVMHVS